MSESTAGVLAVQDALARLENAMDDLLTAPLDPCTDDEIEDVLRRLEVVRNKSAAVDDRLVQQVTQRSMPFHRGCKTTSVYLQYLLRLAPAEAQRRVKAYERFGQRCSGSMTAGPVYRDTAAALASGSISPAHAKVIADTIERLPEQVEFDHGDAVETELVGHAASLDPRRLALAGERIRAHLDPDGVLKDEAAHQRRRHAAFHRRPDGSARLEVEFTPEAAELLETSFDALAKPASAADGTHDPRTPGQRRHDALVAMLKMVMQAQLLPTTAGVTATVLLHMGVEAFVTGKGYATTGHGYRIPAEMAKRWATNNYTTEADIIAVLLTKTKRIEAYSSVQRCFTAQQRLAMMARDFGCTFPFCDSTALHTQAHHIQEWQHGGKTSVDNGTLLCGDNHRNHEKMGWQSVTINGVPQWIPPTFIDPDQKPIRKPDHDV